MKDEVNYRIDEGKGEEKKWSVEACVEQKFSKAKWEMDQSIVVPTLVYGWSIGYFKYYSKEEAGDSRNIIFESKV